MTRIVNNSQCTHEFFYCNHSTVNNDYTFGTQCSFGKSFSDTENNLLNFYSYYTKVAMLYQSHKDSKTYLLIHWDSMTPTTGRHLSYLRSANPYYNTINLPFVYGEHSTSLETIKKNLFDTIQKYNTENILETYSKNYFIDCYNALNDIQTYLLDFNEEEQKLFDNATQLRTYILSDDFKVNKKELSKQKAAKTRAESKAKKEKIEQLKKDIETKYSYYELIKKLFYYDVFDYNQKDFIKNNVLNPYYAYVWFNDDNATLSTSKRIKVNKDDVIKLLKLWKHNKLKHGMMIDRYTVLEVKAEYIKIGCHTIPIENIQALWEEYQKENKIAA